MNKEYILNSYPYLKKLHEGTYGIIYENTDTNEIYKVSKHRDIDTSFIREIYFLKYLYQISPTACKHIIALKNVLILDEVKNINNSPSNPLNSLNSNLIQSVKISQSKSINKKKQKINMKIACIVLEKMDCNLREFIIEIIEKKKNINVLKKIFQIIFIKLLEAVNELQSVNVLHNDLKLINILINRKQVFESNKDEDIMSFELKLCDFGLAIQTSYIDMKECICLGTVKYSAPEMANESVKKFYGYTQSNQNKFQQSTQMDLYSIGVIMSQILFKFMGLQNIDKITQETFLNNFNSSKTNNHIVNSDDNIYRIICNYLNEDPSKRIKIKNVLKVLKKDNNYIFGGNIQQINYTEILKNNIPNFNKTKYDEFINLIKKINEYLIKHYDYHLDKFNFELQFNIFHITYYLLNNCSTINKKLTFPDCVKISIYWVLSIYHHRELSNFKKIIKNTKSILKRNEMECRSLLMNYTKVIPISYFFKTLQLKPKTKQQLLMLMFK
jgi:serine/threonine protein kinase